jgi:ATP sulfurylase
VSAPTPHGGALVDRRIRAGHVLARTARAATLPTITLGPRALADLELIATGAFSPLTGFLGRASYERVLFEGRLSSGVPWPVPITLPVDPVAAARLRVGHDAALLDSRGRCWGILRVAELFARELTTELRVLYGTDRAEHPAHPGVAELRALPRTLVAGPIEVFPLPSERPLAALRRTPAELRAHLADRGWADDAAALVTGAPCHRGLDAILAGLPPRRVVLAHLGAAADDPIAVDDRLATFDDPTLLVSGLPGAPRHAGRREALLDALVARNHGLATVVVGRDHGAVAGDVRTSLDGWSSRDLGVTLRHQPPLVHCAACAGVVEAEACPHPAWARTKLSASALRARLRAGEPPPEALLRPAVAAKLVGRRSAA